MELDRSPVIGIVGGMGPQAGLTLYNHLVANTPATSDQDHLPVILMSFGKEIGDRSEFLDGRLSLNPGYAIAKIIGRLARSGANVVGIACNTAHAPEIFEVILNEVQRSCPSVMLLNMPEEVCRNVQEQFPKGARIGVMATNGTCKTGIYSNALKERGYEIISPPADFQNEVIHRIIYDPLVGIKANPKRISAAAREMLHKAFLFFNQRRADAILLGCTELSMVLPDPVAAGCRILDSSEILAKALIREAIK